MGIFLRFLPVLVAVFLAYGAVIVVRNGTCLGLSDNVAGALAGAMIGAAGIFIGSSLDKLSTWWNARADLEDRSQRIRTLVTAELVNVAAGLIGAHLFLRQIISANAVGPSADLRPYQPRPMPFTAGLGAELLNLSAKQIDVLSTLLGNMQITRGDFSDLIELNRGFTGLDAVKLKNAVSADMLILSEVFEQFAPARKLSLQGKASQLAVTLLRDEAAK